MYFILTLFSLVKIHVILEAKERLVFLQTTDCSNNPAVAQVTLCNVVKSTVPDLEGKPAVHLLAMQPHGLPLDLVLGDVLVLDLVLALDTAPVVRAEVFVLPPGAFVRLHGVEDLYAALEGVQFALDDGGFGASRPSALLEVAVLADGERVREEMDEFIDLGY